MRRPVPVTVAMGIGLTLLAFCTACTSSASDPPNSPANPPAVTAIPSAATVIGLVLPLSSYELTGAQELFVNNATRTLVNQCMRRYGFAQFSLGTGATKSGHPDQMGRRYGAVSDATTAATYGYHLTPDQGAGLSRPSTRPTAPFSQAETAVLTGTSGEGPAPPNQPQVGTTYNGQAVPPGGCFGEANRAIGFDDRVDGLLPQRLAFTAYSQSRNDSRTKEVITAWSACMKDKGYHIADPISAVSVVNLNGPVTPAEIQQAVTDVACKQTVGLIGVWFAVESAYQRRLIEQNSQQLDAVRKLLDDKLRNAARTLGQAAPR